MLVYSRSRKVFPLVPQARSRAHVSAQPDVGECEFEVHREQLVQKDAFVRRRDLPCGAGTAYKVVDRE